MADHTGFSTPAPAHQEPGNGHTTRQDPGNGGMNSRQDDGDNNHVKHEERQTLENRAFQAS